MKLRDIFTDKNTKIFLVTDDDKESGLDWTIEPTDFELIPDEIETFFVRAKQVYIDKTVDCFLSIVTPERITDFVVKIDKNNKVIVENFSDQENSVIPVIASDCFGNYELFYAKENPQLGIDILKDGLTKSLTKNVIAEDLGYILRDEERTKEAIYAFLISEQNEPSSAYIFGELAQLYGQLGQTEKQFEYEQKYEENGGI